MSKIIEIYVHLSKAELEMLSFEYGSDMAIKLFLSKKIDQIVEREAERICFSEKYEMRNATIETDVMSEGESDGIT